LDLHAGRHLSAHLRSIAPAGEVHERRYPWLCCSSGTDLPHEARMARYGDANFVPFFQMVVDRISGPRRRASEIAELRHQVVVCKEKMTAGTHAVVRGVDQALRRHMYTGRNDYRHGIGQS